MAGQNIFNSRTILEARKQGFSRELITEAILPKTASARKTRGLSPICIFLSHRSSDKVPVRNIRDRLLSVGLNVYFDEDDPILQKADEDEDHDTITFSIEFGISQSTHLLTIVSHQTHESWWVPYEIGCGKVLDREIAVLKLKDLVRLPSFLLTRDVKQLTGKTELDAYAAALSKPATPMFNRSYQLILESFQKPDNKDPLQAYLDK